MPGLFRAVRALTHVANRVNEEGIPPDRLSSVVVVAGVTLVVVVCGRLSAKYGRRCTSTLGFLPRLGLDAGLGSFHGGQRVLCAHEPSGPSAALQSPF